MRCSIEGIERVIVYEANRRGLGSEGRRSWGQKERRVVRPLSSEAVRQEVPGLEGRMQMRPIRNEEVGQEGQKEGSGDPGS
jgi:hypothetical protein